MFVGDDLNCSFFFYKPMKLSNKMNIKHNSTIENRATEKTYSRLKFGRRASCFLALGFLALGFLTTGFFALNLQAQDAEDPRKKGFFVGIAPYTMGVTLEKEVKIAEVNDVVIDSVEYDATYGPGLPETFKIQNDYVASLIAVVELCKGNYTLLETPTLELPGDTGDAVIPITEDVEGFEERLRGQIGLLNIQQFVAGGDIDFDNYPAENGDVSYATEAQRIANAARCKAHFDSQRLSSTRAPGTAEKTEEQMSGTGIAFGYNLEKWGLSFSHYNLGAGDNKLQSQVLLADYFLPYGFSVGVGFASMKLDTAIGQISKTAPAIHLGLFSSSIWENLRLEAGYLLLNTELVVQQKQLSNPPQTTAINQEDYVVIGLYEEHDKFPLLKSTNLGDRRIMVRQTQTGSRTVGTEVSTTIRVPAPAAVYLRFIYRF